MWITVEFTQVMVSSPMNVSRSINYVRKNRNELNCTSQRFRHHGSFWVVTSHENNALPCLHSLHSTDCKSMNSCKHKVHRHASDANIKWACFFLMSLPKQWCKEHKCNEHKWTFHHMNQFNARSGQGINPAYCYLSFPNHWNISLNQPVITSSADSYLS